MAISPDCCSQPWRTQYCLGLGSETMRARRFSIAMTLTPSGPGTSICWSRDSGTSRKIFPPLRMTALSARSPLHSLSMSNTTHRPPSNSVSQSPALRCGRMAARMGSCEFTVAHQHLLLLLEMPGEFFGEIDRAVLPAGAAEGNGEITAVIRDVTRQPA